MLLSFGFLQQSADAIVRTPGNRRTQMHGLNSERPDGLRSLPPGDACPQVLVDDNLKGPARTSRLGLKPRGNIFVQGQCGSHGIKMLSRKHHDVYLPCRPLRYTASSATNRIGFTDYGGGESALSHSKLARTVRPFIVSTPAFTKSPIRIPG